MIGALITAGLGAYSAYANAKGGSGSTSSGASAQNLFNAEEAQKNRDFQERMYKNRHKYQVDDLRNAGLNPILSANTAPSAPSGSTATGVNTRLDENAQKLQRLQVMAQLASTAAEIRLKNSQSNLNQGKVNFLGVQTPLSSAKQWVKSTSAYKTYKNAPKAWQIAKDFLKTGSFESP